MVDRRHGPLAAGTWTMPFTDTAAGMLQGMVTFVSDGIEFLVFNDEVLSLADFVATAYRWAEA